MVIMRPDQIFASSKFGCDLRELAIDSLVHLPIFRVKITARGHVVKQRPDDLIGKAGIEFRHFITRKGHRLIAMRPAARRLLQESGRSRDVSSPRPSNPNSVLVTPNAVERRGQSP